VANREHWFSKIATQTANNSGRPRAFGVAGLVVAGWLLTGPLFYFSDTWQLVMNTISSIVTF
jgi:low affinity Fe/Cu permease